VTNFGFLGQKPIGTACLDALLNEFDSSKVKFVISNTHPKGWWNDNKIFEIAKSRGIRFFDFDEVDNDLLHKLVVENDISYLLSVQYNKIIAQEVLDSVYIASYNLHLAPLPQYRGWHSASHSILNGDSIFGSTIHLINSLVDDGEIYLAKTFEYKDESAGELYLKSELVGEQIFCELLRDLKRGKIVKHSPQVGQKRRYRHKDLLERIENEKLSNVLKDRALDFSFRLQNRRNLKSLKI
jgi:methionyl-tRNA formyltransferase